MDSFRHMSEATDRGTRRRLSVDSTAALQRLVQEQPWLFRMPSAFRREFALRRQQQFKRLVVIGTPLLLFMYFSIIISGYLIFSFEIDGADRELWWTLSGLDCVFVFLGLGLAYWPRMLSSYAWWVSILGGLLLADKILLSLMVSSLRLAQHETYVCMMVITVVMLALRLPIGASLLACSCAGAFSVAIARMRGIQPDVPQFLFYFIGSVVVNGFVAWLLERQDRLNFLQALLLEHEAGEREVLNRQLQRLARQDPLSGLSNRRHFDEVLAEEWDRARRDKQELALLFIDVDHFKAFNDTYGHPAGDVCLSRIGVILSEALMRPADLAARYGGEEFVILLPGTSVRGARKVAERILLAVDALAIPHEGSEAAPHVTVSIGLAAVEPERWPLSKALVDSADSALYEAKHLGRHRIVEWHPQGQAVDEG